MKRFLILSILIIFLTVSCAGPNKVKVGWTKPDFRQDEFEGDRKDCFQTYGNSLDSDPFEKVVDECLAKKGYTYHSSQDAEETKEEPTTKERIITVGKTVGIVLLGVTAATLYYGLMFAPRK